MANINVIDAGHSSLPALINFHENNEIWGMSRSCCGYACHYSD